MNGMLRVHNFDAFTSVDLTNQQTSMVCRDLLWVADTQYAFYAICLFFVHG